MHDFNDLGKTHWQCLHTAVWLPTRVLPYCGPLETPTASWWVWRSLLPWSGLHSRCPLILPCHLLLERCVANGKCVLQTLQDSHSLLSVFHNHGIRHAGPLHITVPCQQTATRNNHSWRWIFNNYLWGILLSPCCVEILQLTIYKVRQHAKQRDEKGFHLVGCDGAKVICSQSRVLCRPLLSPFPCTQHSKGNPRPQTS